MNFKESVYLPLPSCRLINSTIYYQIVPAQFTITYNAMKRIPYARPNLSSTKMMSSNIGEWTWTIGARHFCNQLIAILLRLLFLSIWMNNFWEKSLKSSLSLTHALSDKNTMQLFRILFAIRRQKVNVTQRKQALFAYSNWLLIIYHIFFFMLFLFRSINLFCNNCMTTINATY